MEILMEPVVVVSKKQNLRYLLHYEAREKNVWTLLPPPSQLCSTSYPRLLLLCCSFFFFLLESLSVGQTRFVFCKNKKCQMLLQCAHVLKAVKWELLIVDEAHR